MTSFGGFRILCGEDNNKETTASRKTFIHSFIHSLVAGKGIWVQVRVEQDKKKRVKSEPDIINST